MSKRRQKKGQKNGHQPAKTRVWEKTHEVELIAWLDYCLEHGLDFDSTITSHLERSTGKLFNSDQVTRKLKLEWRYWGELGTPSYKDLLDRGSAALVQYTADDSEDLRKAVGRIGPPAGRFAPKQSPQALKTSPSKRARALRTSESATLSAAPTLDPYDLSDFEHDRGQRTVNPKRRRVVRARRSGTRNLTKDKDVQPAFPARALPSAPSKTYSHPASPTKPPALQDAPRAEVREILLSGNIVALDKAREENTHLKSYIHTLSTRLSAANAEVDSIRHSARAAAQHKDNFSMQRDLRYEVSYLKDQIDKMRRQQQRIVNMSGTNSLGPSDKEIRETFAIIHDEIEDVCSSIDIRQDMAIDIQTPVQSESLNGWAQLLGYENLGGLLSSLSNDGTSELKVVGSLAAVGACQLVFQSSFPGFLARESPLLDQYRAIILAQDGNPTLSQLDLLAHQSLISNAHFQSHTLMEATSAMAEELCSSISHLVSLEDLTLGEGSSRAILVDLFTQPILRALDLKAKLLLGRRKYRLVYFKPGESFCPDAMIRNGDTQEQFTLIRKRKGVAPQRNMAPGLNISLCSFPALYSVPEERSDHMSGVEISTVDYRNFVTPETSVSDGDTLVVRAVVLV